MREMPGREMSSTLSVITLSQDKTQKGGKDVSPDTAPEVVSSPASILSNDSMTNLCTYPSVYMDQLSDLPKYLETLLRKMPFFPKNQDSSEIQGLEEFFADTSQVMHVRNFSAGDVIIQEGEMARAMFFVLKGIVKVISEDGEINFGELRPGSYFGEIGILYDIKRTATVRAKTKCTLAVLTSDELNEKLEKYPQIKGSLSSRAQERLERLERERAKAGRRVGSESSEKPAELRKDLSHGSFRELSASRVASRRPSDEGTQYGPSSPPTSQSPTGSTMPEEFTTCSMTLSADLAPPPPSSGSVFPAAGTDALNPQLSNFAMKYGGRRRASVAVWSDDRLMQFAQSATEKHEQKQQHAVRTPSSLLRSVSATSYVTAVTEPSAEETRGHGLLGRDVMARILSQLDFRQRMRVRLCSMQLLRLMLDSCTMLATSVDLSPWHKRIDDKVIGDIVCFCGQTVRNLSLRNCWGVTDKGLATIAHYAAAGLETLCLASVWDITDGGLGSLARMCTHLKDLDLSNCRKLSDAGVLSVLDSCPQIEGLTLSYCKNLSDTVLGHQKWMGIKRLNMQRCTGIRDSGFRRWAAQAADTPNKVRVDNMELTSIDEIELGSTEEMVFAYHNSMKENDESSDGEYSTIPCQPKAGGMSFELEELILSDCSFLTDAAVAAIAASCHKLQILSLSFCCAVTESIAEHLSNGCPELRALDMSFCGTAMTDDSILTLARGLKRLERLSIRGCVQVTERGIAYLGRYARNLRMLNLSQCKNVSAEVVDRTCRRWRLLTCQGLMEVDEADFRLAGTREISKAGMKRERARASTA